MSDQLDHIESYLKGALNAEDANAFEADLLIDASLREKVENHRQLLKGFEIGFNKELKSLLVEEEIKINAAPENEPKRIKSFYFLFGIAAALTVLVVAIFALQDQSFTTEELFAQNYQAYPNVEQPVSRSENNSNNPYALYEHGAYDEALAIFSDMHTSDPENSALLFYSAMCQLELGQTKEAIELFDQVASVPSNKYARPAMWYESLSYLKTGKTEKAKAILEQLSLSEDLYAGKAKNVLEHL